VALFGRDGGQGQLPEIRKTLTSTKMLDFKSLSARAIPCPPELASLGIPKTKATKEGSNLKRVVFFMKKWQLKFNKHQRRRSHEEICGTDINCCLYIYFVVKRFRLGGYTDKRHSLSAKV
jgi:hypothetical protein